MRCTALHCTALLSRLVAVRASRQRVRVSSSLCRLGGALCRAFNATCNVVSFKDKGIVRNEDGVTDITQTMLHVWRRTVSSDTTKMDWLTRNFVPDVVIVNVGEADFGMYVTISRHACSRVFRSARRLCTVH
jgi:hypothetical protein